MRRAGQYVSKREEIWVKPTREDYEVSYILSDAIQHEQNLNLILPLTKKEYDIILHTVKSIRQHGGQFEVLLKVKQSDNNPDFDFLNTESAYHSLYKYLRNLSDEIFWDIYLNKAKPSVLSVLGNYTDDESEVEENRKEGIISCSIVEDMLRDIGLIPDNETPCDPSRKVVDNEILSKRKERVKKARMLAAGGSSVAEDISVNNNDAKRQKQTPVHVDLAEVVAESKST